VIVGWERKFTTKEMISIFPLWTFLLNVTSFQQYLCPLSYVSYFKNCWILSFQHPFRLLHSAYPYCTVFQYSVCCSALGLYTRDVEFQWLRIRCQGDTMSGWYYLIQYKCYAMLMFIHLSVILILLKTNGALLFHVVSFFSLYNFETSLTFLKIL
jgi:hypothetical protein